MEKILVRLGALVVSVMVIMGSTATFGSIIPSAQQAKDNAVAPEFSPVIEIIEGDWVLTPSRQNAGEATISVEDGTVLPLSDHGKEHGVAPDHSLVIDIIGDDWVLTPLSNFGKSDDEVLNVPLELNGEFTEVFSIALIPGQITEPVTSMSQDHSLAVIPEPTTLLVLGLGGLVLRKRK